MQKDEGALAIEQEQLELAKKDLTDELSLKVCNCTRCTEGHLLNKVYAKRY